MPTMYFCRFHDFASAVEITEGRTKSDGGEEWVRTRGHFIAAAWRPHHRLDRACVPPRRALASRAVINFFESILRTIWLCCYPMAIAMLLTLALLVVTTEMPVDLGHKMAITAGWTAVFYAVVLLPVLFLLRTLCRRRFPQWCYALLSSGLSLVAVAYYLRFLSPLPTGVYSMDMVIFCIPVGLYGWLVGRVSSACSTVRRSSVDPGGRAKSARIGPEPSARGRGEFLRHHQSLNIFVAREKPRELLVKSVILFLVAWAVTFVSLLVIHFMLNGGINLRTLLGLLGAFWDSPCSLQGFNCPCCSSCAAGKRRASPAGGTPWPRSRAG